MFNLERPGYIYSEFLINHTVLEERISALEGGVGAVAASGHAALVLGILTIMGQGGHIVASSALYGGTLTCLVTLCHDLE